uniref:Uncharacterized protein n=1 Tax=Anguilla anguilla TaxID=7936 RepID=A0A0E9QRN6_ANGAN
MCTIVYVNIFCSVFHEYQFIIAVFYFLVCSKMILLSVISVHF